jgi:hypothetical protein
MVTLISCTGTGTGNKISLDACTNPAAAKPRLDYFWYPIAMDPLETRIVKIEERNKSVEFDKGWETSWTRLIIIALFTYVVVAIFLNFINVPRPWITALVPVIGFTLSTITMPFFKKLWIRYHY